MLAVRRCDFHIVRQNRCRRLRLRRGRYRCFWSMTRLVLKAIDVGASFVFMALCAKAFCTHFCNDLRRACRSLAPSAEPGRLVMLYDRARVLARSDRPETMP